MVVTLYGSTPQRQAAAMRGTCPFEPVYTFGSEQVVDSRSASKGRLLHMERRKEAPKKEAVTFLESSQGSLTSGPHSGKRGHILTWRSIFVFRAAGAVLARTTCLTHRKGKETNIYQCRLHVLCCCTSTPLRGYLSHVVYRQRALSQQGSEKRSEVNAEKAPPAPSTHLADGKMHS
ncbi:hypothetical protein TREES_T100015574 [Tupaia chinensis]|uniref:Uncharacterized protein n=1 Tax=Tupaia chinensis TaxID=246437 RepID=L9LAY3_TUPCH|nr:hypothetical protein TREES_T100015574 [Tupaia chinensis]